eukprot:TRINITY_DN9440_c0_g1_i1.p1 TRINITY_DN9440_c0_g1~~TRINITY_DN9440_c0_g1_i1.p1  ORF type:complete len:1369 (-),score=312.27 TRINITY_DN9440_c0_g1_i1:339-4445(-)
MRRGGSSWLSCIQVTLFLLLAADLARAECFISVLGEDTSACGSILAACATLQGAVSAGCANITILPSTYTNSSNFNVVLSAPTIIRGSGAVFDGTLLAPMINFIYMTGGDLSISGIRVQNLVIKEWGGSAGVIMADGGSLTVDNCTFVNCTVNAYYGSVVGSDNSIQLLTVTNSVFVDNYAPSGGAVYADSCTLLQITNCVFVRNRASDKGGAIYSECHVAISSSVFLNNSLLPKTIAAVENSQRQGGAAYLNFATLTDCTFRGNSAPYGSAVYIFNPTGDVTNCTFDGNLGTENCTGTEQCGGTLVFDAAQNHHVNVYSSTFTNNVAYVQGAAIYSTSYSVRVYDSVFTHNTAVDAAAGGIISIPGGRFGNCTFEANVVMAGSQTGIQGGVMYLSSTWAFLDPYLDTISDTLFRANRIVGSGGTNTVQGGALYLTSGSFSLVNVTFENNSIVNVASGGGGGGYGAAMFVVAGDAALFQVINSTFSANSVQASVSMGGAIYDDSGVSYVNCAFMNNSAESGGALFASVGANISQCAFNGNTAVNGSGGAVFASTGSISIAATTFISNSATAGGFGGAIAVAPAANATLTSLTMTGNSAVNGGAAAIVGSCLSANIASLYRNASVLIMGGLVSGNQAVDSGGAVYASCGAVEASNASFTGNTACYGGAIASAVVASESGAFQPQFSGITVTDNAAVISGGGLFSFSQQSFAVTGVKFTNNSAGVYGQSVASAPVGLRLTTCVANETTAECMPLNAASPPIAAGVILQAQLALTDAYSQVIPEMLPEMGDGALPMIAMATANTTLCSAIGALAVLTNGQAAVNITVQGGANTTFALQFALLNAAPFIHPSNVAVARVTTCAPGFAVTSGVGYDACAVTCTPCSFGTYDVTGSGACRMCPSGAVCSGASLYAATGSFALVSSDGQVSTMACVNCVAACLGMECAEPAPVDCVPVNAASEKVTGYCSVGSRCSVGYEGFLCSDCAPGFGYWNGQCVDCSRPSTAVAVVIFIALWILVVLLIIFPVITDTVPMTHVLVHFLQTGLFLQGPGSVSFSIFGLFALRPSGGDICLYQQHYAQSLVTHLMIVVVVFFVLVVSLAVTRVVMHCRQMHWELRKMVIGCTAMFLLVVYMPIAAAVLDMLACTSIDTGMGSVRVLNIAMGISCDSDLFQGYFATGVVLIIVVAIGLPVFFLVIALRDRSAMHGEHHRPQFRWWSVVLLMQRLIIATAMLISDRGGRSYLLLVVLVVYLLAHSVFRPFSDSVVDNTTVVVTLAGILFLFGHQSLSVGVQAFNVVVYVFLCVLLGLLWAVHWSPRLRESMSANVAHWKTRFSDSEERRPILATATATATQGTVPASVVLASDEGSAISFQDNL